MDHEREITMSKKYKDMFEENESSEMKISQTAVKFPNNKTLDDSLVDFSSKRVLDFAVLSFKRMIK